MNATWVRRAARRFCVGFAGKTVSSELAELIDLGVAGVILFSRNVGTPLEVFELTRAIKALRPEPIVVAVDQEGGPVRRLRAGFTELPALCALGASDDQELARGIGTVLGRELRAVGIDWDFAPVLDVASNPQNPVIGVRSIGPDPERVAELGVELALALEAQGVAACGKHFPGHGDTALDSHLALPSVPHDRERLDRVEFLPFARAARAGIASIMTAHVLFPVLDAEYPASMSASLVTDVLRTELGYTGLVVSDDLEMSAIVDHYGIESAVLRGVSAGADMFLMCHSAERAKNAIFTLASAMEQGELSTETFDAGERRVQTFLERFASPPRDRPDLGALRAPEHLALAERLAAFAPSAPAQDATGDR